MKYNYILFGLFALLLVLATPVHATTFLDDGFELGNVNNWNTSGIGSVTAQSAVVITGSYSAKQTDTGAGSNTMLHHIAGNSFLNVTFNIRFQQTTSQHIITIADSSLGTDGFKINFFSDGTIRYYDGSAWTQMGTSTYAINTNYKISVIANADTDRFDVYINDVLQCSSCRRTDREPYTNFYGIVSTTQNTGSMVTYLDDVNINNDILLTTNLVAYYSFDDDNLTGSNPLDLTGNGHTGVNTGATTGVTAKVLEGFSLDGTNDEVVLGSSNYLSGATKFTINQWVYVTAYDVIVDQFLGAWSGTNQVLVRVASGNLQFYMIDSGSNQVGGTTQALSTTGSWMMITAVYDGTDMKTYVNNVPSGTTISNPGKTLRTSTNLLNIGNYNSGTSFSQIKVDEVGLWSRALNTTEISNLYNSGSGLSYYNFLTPPATPSTPVHEETLQQDVSIEQTINVTIDGTSYATVTSSSITLSDDAKVYVSASVPLNPNRDGDTAYCQITLDGAEFGNSETSRSLTAGSIGNMLISTNYENLTAGTYDIGLACHNTDTHPAAYFEVFNSDLMVHIMTSSDGMPLQYEELEISNAAITSGVLDSVSITTSENATDTGLTRSLVTEWAANYVYTATGDISITTELAGVNCSAVTRYGVSGTTGSVGGVCYQNVGNETNSTAYDLRVFGTGTGNLTNAIFHVKEMILHDDEISMVNLTGLTGDGTINSLNINVSSGHTNPDLLAQAILSVYSTSGTQTGSFYLTADAQNSSTVSRTSGLNEAGVLGIHKDFETVPDGVTTVSLIGDCSLCSFTGQNVLAFISNDVAATPNSYDVTLASVYGGAINEFTINLSDGREFSTTTGTVTVPNAPSELVNITVSENSGAAIPYFANYTLNHNTTDNIELKVTTYTAFTVTGNATVNNFTVNGTSTTSGTVYLRLFNDTYTLAMTDADDINGAEYANTNATVTASPYLESYAFVPKYSNTINISFYDEETATLIQPETIYLEAISESQAGNYTTTTGTITENFLLPDTYTLRYTALGYSESFYYLTINDRSFNALNLTLLNSTSADQVTLTVYDTLGNKLEGATVKVLKYDVSSNSYNVVEILNTNFEGVAVANIVLNSEYYKFIIDYEGTTRLTTTPTYIYGTTLTFYIPITSAGMEDYFSKGKISGTLTFNKNTDLATFTYSDTDNSATQGCLYAYTRSLGTNTLVNSSCSSSSSGSLYLYTNNASSSWYLEGKVTKGGEEHLISTYKIDYDLKLTETGLGSFFAFIVLATIVFIGLFSLEVAVVLAAAVPLLFTITKLANFDYIWSVPILLLGFIVAFIIGSNKK